MYFSSENPSSPFCLPLDFSLFGLCLGIVSGILLSIFFHIVGNIPWNIDEITFYNTFQHIGQIYEARVSNTSGGFGWIFSARKLEVVFLHFSLTNGCKLVNAPIFSFLQIIIDKNTNRSKGFGFITFIKEEDAQKAIGTYK